jgi:DNA-binding response OmpR family regulator
MHVLVVEDETGLARKIAAALTESGHDAVTVHDGQAGLDLATKDTFDLVILDVGLPTLNGFEVLQRLHSQRGTTRVLMLTARSEIKDRVSGLQMGADDYLPKPFAMPELIARIQALGRRYPEEPAINLTVADVTFDLANHEVFRGSRQIELSPRELTLLKALMREPGRAFTRTELCERVWEHPHEYDTKLVEVFIGRLRKKLGEPQLIRTVRHVGYSIDAGGDPQHS